MLDLFNIWHVDSWHPDLNVAPSLLSVAILLRMIFIIINSDYLVHGLNLNIAMN